MGPFRVGHPRPAREQTDPRGGGGGTERRKGVMDAVDRRLCVRRRKNDRFDDCDRLRYTKSPSRRDN